MKRYTKKILQIAIPITLSNLISQFQMLIDRMFLGQLDITCMSAVGNATSPMWTTMNIIFALTTGATILVSQAYGAGETKRAKDLTASLFLYNNILAIAMFLFWLLGPRFVFGLMGVDKSIIEMSVTYAKVYSPIFILTGIGASVSSMLQVCQKTSIMAVYGISRSVINVVLDYCLIFGHWGFPEMGVAGAALGTLIAEFVGDIIVLIYVIYAKDIWLKPSLNSILHADFKAYIQSVKLGIPPALEGFAWNLGNLYLIAMLNKVSIEAAGIHSIIFGVECVAIVIFDGIGVATLTLSGYETGQNNVKGVWDVVVNSVWLALVAAVINMAVFLIFPQEILAIFTKDASVIAVAATYLLIVGIDLFPKAGNIIFGSGIKGYGDPSWMLKTQLVGTAFVIAGSTILVIVMGKGMTELFCLVVADEVLRFIFNYGKLSRVRKTAG